MEQNTAWQQINSGVIEETLYDLVLPVMQCRGNGISPGENRISYVANAGPINMHIAADVGMDNSGSGGGGGHDSWLPSDEWIHAEFGLRDRPQRDAIKYTIFFDRIGGAVGPWSDTHPPWSLCKTKITVNNISSMDGTSNTILLSENEDAGHWIWHF